MTRSSPSAANAHTCSTPDFPEQTNRAGPKKAGFLYKKVNPSYGIPLNEAGRKEHTLRQGGVPTDPFGNDAGGGEVLCIPYSAKNPEGALKFLAWLWGSQDNYLFCLYGEKGKDWDLDQNGRLVTLSETARGDGYFYE